MKVKEGDFDIVLQMKKEGYSNRHIAKELWGDSGYESRIRRFLKDLSDDESVSEHPSISNSCKVLYYDIETTPNISYHWGNWKANIGYKQRYQESFMLSHSWAWNNGDIAGSILTKEEVLEADEERIVLEAWSLFDNCDVVVGHNAKNFDIRKMNGYFLKFGLPPPSPYKVIDTLSIAKRKFNLQYNNLAYLAEYLGVTQKIDSGGMDTWIRCMRGEQEALDEMLEYNKGDIDTLRQIHQKLIAWDNDGVNISLYNDDDVLLCTHCGSDDISKVEGKVVTTVQRKYQLYKCNSCGCNLRDKTMLGVGNTLTRVV